MPGEMWIEYNGSTITANQLEDVLDILSIYTDTERLEWHGGEIWIGDAKQRDADEIRRALAEEPSTRGLDLKVEFRDWTTVGGVARCRNRARVRRCP